jgi:signal transduction histidine kinase
MPFGMAFLGSADDFIARAHSSRLGRVHFSPRRHDNAGSDHRGSAAAAAYIPLGLAIWISYLGAFIAGKVWNILDLTAWDSPHLAFVFMLTLLSTGLAAVLYGQRTMSYSAQQESVRIAQDLAAAQVRALLSENAISVGKLAAALTHELNTPLGALKSSVDTMVVLAAKQATAPPKHSSVSSPCKSSSADL